MRVVVIGGGFTGAAFVIHAARALEGPVELDVVEPAPDIGRGVAYGASDPLQPRPHGKG